MYKAKHSSEFPRETIVLDCTDPLVVNVVIKTLTDADIPCYSGTKDDGFDPEYQYLGWDRSQLTQYSQSHEYSIQGVEDFLNLFLESKDVIVELNDKYSATILPDKVKVGCQEFTFDAIEKLYNAIQGKRENM